MKCALAGVDVFRLNFSHGAHGDHTAALDAVRAAEAALGRPLAALADLQGPKFRLGQFAAGRITMTAGDMIRLDSDSAPGDARRIFLPHPEVLRVLHPALPACPNLCEHITNHVWQVSQTRPRTRNAPSSIDPPSSRARTAGHRSR